LDTAPPGLQAKFSTGIHTGAHCTATPRPVAFIDASFDDVLVNE
jgi:hypothetical protein